MKSNLNKETFTISMAQIAVILLTFLVVVLLIIIVYNKEKSSNQQVTVDLPEEYQLITTKDTLQGHYDKESNKLYISFKNKRNQ